MRSFAFLFFAAALHAQTQPTDPYPGTSRVLFSAPLCPPDVDPGFSAAVCVQNCQLWIVFPGGTKTLVGPAQPACPTTPPPVDMALGKPATQISTLYGGTPNRAVDGKTDGAFWDGSVTHTDLAQMAWWEVDLGQPQLVQSVTVWNRTDCCGDRLADYWVFVSNVPFQDSDTPASIIAKGVWGNHQGTAPNPATNVNAGQIGRYIRIQLTGTNYLALAEIQVWGIPGLIVQ